MLILHHMFCVLLTLTLLCVRVTSATNQHTLSVPSNINNTHSYSLIQGKLLQDNGGAQQEQLKQHQQQANELLIQIEKIVTATNESIAEVEEAVKKAEQENSEAIKIFNELKEMNGSIEEYKNATKEASSTTFFASSRARSFLDNVKEGTHLSSLKRKLTQAIGQNASLYYAQEVYKSENELRILQSQLRDANTTVKQIEKKLQEIMEEVKKVNEAFKDAQSIKTQVESKLNNKTPVSSQPSVSVPQSQSNTGTNSAQGINNPETDSTQEESFRDNRRIVTRENTNDDSREEQQLRTGTEKENNTTPSEANKNKNESPHESKTNTRKKDEIADLNNLSITSIQNDMDGTNTIGWVPSLPIMFILLTVFPCVILG